jgi:2,4-dienoyl-CoA reductase-like NADH-dependent reductase (Old Yellow Enzyme family)
VQPQTLTSSRTPERFIVVSDAQGRRVTARQAGAAAPPTIFDPIEINGIQFRNRLMRSSIGGRTAYYDGTISDAFRNFEMRFAIHGVGSLVSPTLTVDDKRWSPLQYPKISRDEFVEPLAKAIKPIQALGCIYIIQIGDPGSHTQTSLFPQPQDELSCSNGVDWLYGYVNKRREMTKGQIQESIHHFAEGARRARDTGAKGLELTASKGYLIHQFLNPQTNKRTDEYGGDLEGRSRFLGEVVQAIRARIGRDYLFGVRLSANDFNEPWLSTFRSSPVWPWSKYPSGNDTAAMLKIAEMLRDGGVDYLHISNGFGFVNLHENPGRFPTDEFRMFLNSTRHLSRKAAIRATLANLFPGVVNWAANRGAKSCEEVQPSNLHDAAQFRQCGLPVICNGGFSRRAQIAEALATGGTDIASMARGLMANPNLPEQFFRGEDKPGNPCSFCNRCAIRTTLFPIGCYDLDRFGGNQDLMEKQITTWAKNPFGAE